MKRNRLMVVALFAVVALIGFVIPNQSGASPKKSNVSLEDTYWKLVKLGEKEVMGTSKKGEPPHIRLLSQDKRVVGSGGCNRIKGGYQLDGEKITFQGVASTMMACPEGMKTEAAFLKSLPKVKTWKVQGESLELLGDNGVLLEFQAVSTQ